MWAVSYRATGCCDRNEEYFVSTETEANDLKYRLEEFFEEESYFVYQVRVTTPDDVMNTHIADREEMTRRDAAYKRVKAEWIASDAYANRKRVIVEPLPWERELAENRGETLKVEYDEWADSEAEADAYTEWCISKGYAKREYNDGWTRVEFIY